MGSLIAALVIPGLFGLMEREISTRRTRFRGRGWAIFALTGIVLLWCLRYVERDQAHALLSSNPITTEPTTRIGIEPYPLDPFHWHAILETQTFYQTAEINSRTGDIDSDPQTDQFFKPDYTPAIEAAKRTSLGQVYLDWGTWAVIRDLGPVPVRGIDPPKLPPDQQWTTVEFSDLRFTYNFRGTGRSSGPPPLSGNVYIVDDREEAGQADERSRTKERSRQIESFVHRPCPPVDHPTLDPQNGYTASLPGSKLPGIPKKRCLCPLTCCWLLPF